MATARGGGNYQLGRARRGASGASARYASSDGLRPRSVLSGALPPNPLPPYAPYGRGRDGGQQQRSGTPSGETGAPKASRGMDAPRRVLTQRRPASASTSTTPIMNRAMSTESR